MIKWVENAILFQKSTTILFAKNAQFNLCDSFCGFYSTFETFNGTFEPFINFLVLLI